MLALDADATVISRQIEFTPENFGTCSIEPARLLVSAASDVIYDFPDEATQGLLTPPELLSIPDNAHEGGQTCKHGQYPTVHYTLWECIPNR